MATEEPEVKFVEASKFSENSEEDKIELMLAAFASFREMVATKFPNSPLATKTALELLGKG